MQTLHVDNKMLAPIGGAFYPSGYAMLMFPSEAEARAAGQRLMDSGFSGDELYLAPPALVLSQITPTVAQADEPLPSAGADATMVRAITKLAREGHAGLLVKAEDEDAQDAITRALGPGAYSLGLRYRMLVIEEF